MGWVMMSERELNRIEVLAQIDDDGWSSKLAKRAKEAARAASQGCDN